MNLQSRNPAGILIPKIGTASPPPCCDAGAVKAITPAPEMTARSNKAIHLISSPPISACGSNDRLRTGLHGCLCSLMLWEVFCEQQENNYPECSIRTVGRCHRTLAPPSKQRNREQARPGRLRHCDTQEATGESGTGRC